MVGHRSLCCPIIAFCMYIHKEGNVPCIGLLEKAVVSG